MHVSSAADSTVLDFRQLLNRDIANYIAPETICFVQDKVSSYIHGLVLQNILLLKLYFLSKTF